MGTNYVVQQLLESELKLRYNPLHDLYAAAKLLHSDMNLDACTNDDWQQASETWVFLLATLHVL